MTSASRGLSGRNVLGAEILTHERRRERGRGAAGGTALQRGGSGALPIPFPSTRSCSAECLDSDAVQAELGSDDPRVRTGRDGAVP